MKYRFCLLLFLSSLGVLSRGQETSAERYNALDDPEFFPIGVWMQHPRHADAYQELGINMYVNLWKGPTVAQLDRLKASGMKVICPQNEVGLSRIDDPDILAWNQMDEPDNAQKLKGQKGYGPPVLPEVIQERYREIKAADPSRPVYLNLGMALAFPGVKNRGVRSNHPEDYPEYLKGCDIASFDIYPASSNKEGVSGNLWLVPHGVDKLMEWTDGKKPVWTLIECTAISHAEFKPTIPEVKAQVWMAIVHGVKSITYFVHSFAVSPPHDSALLTDPEMMAAVKEINAQIQALAPVLNSPTVESKITVSSSNPEVPVDILVKEFEGETYLFAVAMRRKKARATFMVKGFEGEGEVEVLDEDRSIPMRNGVFSDTFEPYAVHLYRF